MTAKAIFILLLAIGHVGILSAQDNVDTKEMVGFACYFGGEQSITVKKVTRKLQQGKYKSIKKMLFSENNAVRYMAVITLEKLLDLNEIELSNSDSKQIRTIKNSKELVSICSGCSSFYKTELRKLFEPDMKYFAYNWLNYYFKKFENK
nr:hypothetical protein [uncultured Carboxylicivirga sp.]